MEKYYYDKVFSKKLTKIYDDMLNEFRNPCWLRQLRDVWEFLHCY